MSLYGFLDYQCTKHTCFSAMDSLQTSQMHYGLGGVKTATVLGVFQELISPLVNDIKTSEGINKNFWPSSLQKYPSRPPYDITYILLAS